MAEKELDKIIIEEKARPGKNPVVIWVPEWIDPPERKKYFVMAAKERADEISLMDGTFERVSGRDIIGEYWDLLKDLPNMFLFTAKLVYTHYRRELFSPSEKGFRESFVEYANVMARETI